MMKTGEEMKGVGLVGFQLSINLIGVLRQTGALSKEQAIEIIEQALLAFETFQTTAGDAAEEVQAARQLLELYRSQL